MILSCKKGEKDFGTLIVKSSDPGLFEIYRVNEVSDHVIEYSSQSEGKFNQEIKLKPGRYILFSDCSHLPLTIDRGRDVVILTKQIVFVPPVTPNEGDKFVIQCERGPEKGFRQKITNQFKINVLPGPLNLLVGVTALNVNKQTVEQTSIEDLPKPLTFELAALEVKMTTPLTSYYVSAKSALVPIAEEQLTGQRLFLLPGNYALELNGTKQEYSLNAKDHISVTPVLLRINTPPEIDLDAYEKIARRPIEVTTQANNLFSINTDQPVLPVPIDLYVNDSLHSNAIKFEEGKKKVINLQAVRLIKDCVDPQKICLSKRAVYLFKEGDNYPFIKGLLDVPLIYHADSPLTLSLDTSGSIKYHLPNKLYAEIGVGDLEFNLSFADDINLKTDFIRVIPKSPGFEGASFDIDINTLRRVPLIEGNYQLLHFFSTPKKNADTRSQILPFSIRKGKTTSLPLTVFRAKG